ncbi:MAG: BTAD domain-containing putative transcriptional regulator [bacterium]|nr:BTAD domain-containing putative transcriptional regulator [bacterium]
MAKTVQPSLILRSKLQLPRPKPETLKRPRLMDALGNQLDRRLLVITGDAGYGKTTLLAQISEKARLPGVFLSLEPEDSDLVTFYSGLVCGLERLQPGLAKRCQGLVDRGTDIGKNHRLAMGTLLNELVEKRNEELFIFLDDYHSLSDDSEVHQALDYFIDHLPPGVHLVIASRKEPPLPSLPKWRAKRDLAELSRESLKFTEEEIRSLLEQFYKISLSETDIKGLAQKTEGWITGVQLILQAAGRDGRSVREMLNAYLEEHGDLFRYFAGEIFNRENEDLKDFLKRSSVLDVMTAESCRYVLKANKSERQLEELVNSNLFVSMTNSGEYRYHRLFREFLYDQLTDPGERSGLHARAAEHHEKNGESAKAIGHYLSADKHREAVRLIDRDRERLINRAQFALLRSWLERLAPQVYDEFPWLYAVQAVLCKEQGKLEQAENLYQRAEKQLQGKAVQSSSRAYVLYEKSIVLHRKGESKEALTVLKLALKCCAPENSDLKTSILGFTAQVWLEGLGDANKAKTCLNQARKLLKGTSNKMQAVYIEQKQSVLWESIGEKRKAFNIYKGIIEMIGDDYSHLVGSYFHNAAKVALDYGRYDWAGECLNKGQAVCRGYEDIFSESMLEFGYGYLYLFKGEWDRAQKHLERAHDIFKEMNWTRSVCIALRQLSRLSRYRGDPDQARHYLELMKQQPLGPLDRIAVLMEQAMIGIFKEQYGPAREALDSCREQAIKYFGKMGEIICYLAEAGIQAGLKRPKEAERWFLKAVTLSKDYGFDGLLACELRASPSLCRLAQKCTIEKTYLLTIPSFMSAEVKGPAQVEAGLRVELMGTPGIFRGEKEITSGLRRQARQLLCLLAYHWERGLNREEILEAMWPRVKPKQAVDNFHLVLFEVRQGLQKSIGRSYGKAIVKEGGRYRIGPGLPVRTDVRAFEELLAGSRESEKAGDNAASKKSMAQALSLKRGEFCQGWAEDWVQGISRRLEDLHQKALLKLGALHLRDGELETSRECYELAIGRDELCEEACRGLIRIHGAKGDLNQARALFANIEKALRKELKAEPATETMEIYRMVMAPKK